MRVGGVGFQPAEFAKIALAIFFAGYLVTHRDTLALAGPKVLGLQLPRARDLGPILIVWAASVAVLVLERDLGTSLLFFGLFVAMLYLATERLSWVVIGLGLFVVGAVLAATAFSHVGARFDAWLHAFDPDGVRPEPGRLRAAGARPVRHGQRRAVRHRLGPGPAGPRAVRGVRLHRRVARRGARPDRACSRSCSAT